MTGTRDPHDVLVDLGRSHVRVVSAGVDHTAAGGAGLADPGGAGGVAARVAEVLTAALAGDRRPSPPWRLAVALPGVATAPGTAATLAADLARRCAPAPTDVLVVSDSAAWQVGACGNADAAVLALGTGAVVVARTAGTVVRLDGLGLLLGDVGGGAWTGRDALRRAARAAGGPLHAAAVVRFGPRFGWPDLLAAPDLAARLAAFVPDVVELAGGGDADALATLDAATAGLLDTLADLPADLPLAVVGGLAPVLGPRLRTAAPGRVWVEPAGDVVAGLRTLLDDAGPFEGEAVRLRSAAARPERHDTDTLPTEGVAADTDGLDTWPTERLVARLVAGHEPALRAAAAAVGPLARAVDLVAAALGRGGRLVYVGAGTPGRLALQDAAELAPTFGLPPERAVVLLAGGSPAGARAVENAEDDVEAAAVDVVTAAVGPDDVVVGISASGRTPYVLAALRASRERGAATVAVSNVPGSPLSHAADVAVDLPTGPEVVAGSTRLAAGTAQKLVLNTLSTAAMVRGGSTYGPWMVDVLATNDKLRRRSVRIVRDAAGVDEDVAAAALTAARGAVPVALVALLTGLDAEPARVVLARAGSVRAAAAASASASAGAPAAVPVPTTATVVTS